MTWIKRITTNDLISQTTVNGISLHEYKFMAIIYGQHRNKILKRLTKICNWSIHSKFIEWNASGSFHHDKWYRSYVQKRLSQEWPVLFVGTFSDRTKFLLKLSYNIDLFHWNDDTDDKIIEVIKSESKTNCIRQMYTSRHFGEVSDQFIITDNRQKG